MHVSRRRTILQTFTVVFLMVLGVHLAPAALAQSDDDKRRADDIRIALMRLPYYGVFDFLSFTYENADKQIAGVRAREVTGTFGVENELIVEKKGK